MATCKVIAALRFAQRQPSGVHLIAITCTSGGRGVLIDAQVVNWRESVTVA